MSDIETKDKQVLLPIENYYPLVKTTSSAIFHSLIKKKIFLRTEEVETELYQEGMVALIECYNRFSENKIKTSETYDETKRIKHKKGFDSFSTYALHRIRGKMLDYLRTLDTMSRNTRAKFKKIEADYKNKVINEETKNKLLHEMSTSLTTEFQNLATNTDTSDSNVAFYDFEDPDNIHLQIEMSHTVNKFLSNTKTLSNRERYVLKQYYFKDENFKTIAGALGILESRVSQLHGSALNKIRQEHNTEKEFSHV